MRLSERPVRGMSARLLSLRRFDHLRHAPAATVAFAITVSALQIHP
jgi:hypothetical protein